MCLFGFYLDLAVFESRDQIIYCVLHLIILILIRIVYVLLYITIYGITPKSMYTILLDWLQYTTTIDNNNNNNDIIEMANNSHAPQYDNHVNHGDEVIIINEEQTLCHCPMSLRIVSYILALLFGFVFIYFLPDLIGMFVFVFIGDPY